MSSRCLELAVSIALCVVPAIVPAADGQSAFRVISYMDDLDQPAGIIEGSPGVFYSEAGQSGTHVVLSITAQGSITTLASIRSPEQIPSLLITAANGRFYSSIEQGASPGHIFSVTSTPDSRQTYPGQNLHPILTQNLPDSNLLCMAVAPARLLWSLAKVDLNGVVTSIYQFPSGERLSAAIYASDGNYYGISQATDSSTGYIYRITPAGHLTKLHSFPAGTFYGYFPLPVLEAGDGNLYGAIPTGGSHGTGTIYRLTLDGRYTEIYSYPKGSLGGPTALIEGGDGNLYGATLGDTKNGGYSQLFRVSKTGQYSIVYDMNDLRNDGACHCSLVQGSDGMIYGTAAGGGIHGGGLYFALNAGQAKPAPRPRSFEPRSGAPGTKVLIWGAHMLSAAVRFNGIKATAVSSSGSNYIWATVPAGATTGPLTVTTPGGTAATRSSFVVR